VELSSAAADMMNMGLSASAHSTAALCSGAYRTDRHGDLIAQRPDRIFLKSRPIQVTASLTWGADGAAASVGKPTLRILGPGEGKRPAAALSPTRPLSGFPRASSLVLPARSCSIGHTARWRHGHPFGRVIPLPHRCLVPLSPDRIADCSGSGAGLLPDRARAFRFAGKGD
jgi:hypothetical protein